MEFDAVYLALAAGADSSAAMRSWPDGIDALALAAYALVALGVPLLGYVFMVADVRRYLRSLRRALVTLAHVATPGLPYWAYKDQPPCLRALELKLPCTEQQVLAAYRNRVKALHPDRGGDLQQFLRLQKHFEQAMYLARTGAKSSPPAAS